MKKGNDKLTISVNKIDDVFKAVDGQLSLSINKNMATASTDEIIKAADTLGYKITQFDEVAGGFKVGDDIWTKSSQADNVYYGLQSSASPG